jgi:carboxyl-terminal processing protease
VAATLRKRCDPSRRVRFLLPLALAAVPFGPELAAAQTNLSFELGDLESPQGWSAQRVDERVDVGEIRLDAAVAAAGARSLKITQRDAADFVRVGQTLPLSVPSAPAGTHGPRRVRVSAAVRDSGAAGAEPALWLRISGGKGALFVDSRGDGRERLLFADAARDRAAPPAAASAGPASARPAEWSRREIELPLPDDADEVAFGALLRGAGSAWFDDFAIAVVPVGGSPPSAAAARYVDAALDLVQRHAWKSAAVDWPALRSATLEHARGARSAADTYPALRFALRELGDRHSYLLAPGPAAALLAAPVSNARTGRAAVDPTGALLAGKFGYLSVPGYAGGTAADQVRFAEGLQHELASLDVSAACGWILDLRRNTGGNLWPMLAGLGPLLGDGELAASVYPDASRRSIWYEQGRAGFGDYVQLRVANPYVLRQTAAPLAVLIGGRTASSAEVLVAALRGRAATRTFGAPTRGLSAGNRTFELADRAALVLTVAATSDRAGGVDLGPIAPDERVAERGGGDPVTGSDAVVAAAAAWLQTREPCR